MIKEPIRAAVISDTHGLLRPQVEQVIQSCDAVIHAGDFDNQMLYHKLKIKQPLYAVRGNNDGDWAEQLPKIRRFSLGGFQFLMVHEQFELPKTLGDAQIIIFGHSHLYAQKQEEGRLWLNPGSCGYRRFTLPLSMAVLTLEEDSLEVETIWLEEEGEKGREITIRLKKSELVSKKNKEKSDQDKPHKHKEGIKGKLCSFQKKKAAKDQLFLIAKITRLMKRGESVEWVAKNLQVSPHFAETIYRIYVTHPGVNAQQILDKIEANQSIDRKRLQ